MKYGPSPGGGFVPVTIGQAAGGVIGANPPIRQLDVFKLPSPLRRLGRIELNGQVLYSERFER